MELGEKMARKGSVKYLHNAKSAKNDEFYTILSDIEKELRHYKKHFKNKVVFCNCDESSKCLIFFITVGSCNMRNICQIKFGIR